jgi:hypothetical protein
LGKQAAVAAVERHFSAVREKADGPDAILTLAGQRIAVEVATLKRKIAGGAKPRLRFDKAVRQLIGDLQAALTKFVPDGEAVIVTCTAPIRLGSKTAAELESKIRDRLARRSAKADIQDTINGNHIRVRFVKGVAARASRVVGFVHNPDSDAHVLLDIAQSLLQHIGAPAKGSPKERWLVLVVDGGFIETWRQIYDQLAMPMGLAKILMVFPDGRVETLEG